VSEIGLKIKANSAWRDRYPNSLARTSYPPPDQLNNRSQLLPYGARALSAKTPLMTIGYVPAFLS